MRTLLIAGVCLGVLGGCATTTTTTTTSPAPEPVGFRFEAAADDPAAAAMQADVAAARARVESYFGQPFAEPLRAVLAPDRAAFDAVFPAEWGIAPTQCWMVGVGSADFFALLSPSAWAAQACEHDASDAEHVRGIIAHELTHSYHGQRNPTRDFTGAEEIGWFIEGLAVVVSGQNADAREAIAAGAAPASLADVLSGSHSYRISGSMAAYIDATYGRETIVALLEATSQQQIMDRLDTNEADFLAAWRAWATR